MSCLQGLKDRIINKNLSLFLFSLLIPFLLFLILSVLRWIHLNDEILLDIFVGTFFLLLCLFAVLHASSDHQEHFQSGKNIPTFPLSLALASFFGWGIAIMCPGLLFHHGFDGLLPSLGITGGLFALLLSLGAVMRRSGVVTLPELLGLRFGPSVHIVALLLSAAITLGLLIVGFSSTVTLTARFFHMPLSFVSAIYASMIACLVIPSGLRSTLNSNIILFFLLAVCLLGLLTFLSVKLYGDPLPQLSLLTALKEVGPAEEGLIEKGLVDFGLFKSFTKEFLTVDRLNWFLLSLSLVSALCVCPPLLQIHGCGRSQLEARKSVALALMWVVLLLTALPFAALLTRLELYSVVGKEPPFSRLPGWILAASEREMISVHGVSLSLTQHVASAVRRGAENRESILDTFKSLGVEETQRWQRLDDKVQKMLMVIANKNALSSPQTKEILEKDFVANVLPLAAERAGNTSGHPTLSAFEFDPEGLLLALTYISLETSFFKAFLVFVVMGSGLGFCSLLTASLVNMLIQDGQRLLGRNSRFFLKPILSARIVALLILLFLSLGVSIFEISKSIFLVVSLSLSAVCLFPAVLMGGWWNRANTMGCLAGMLAGLGFFLFYFLGTSTWSVHFYETWSFLSNAGPEAYADFRELKSSWALENGETKAMHLEDLHLHTSGSFWSPGLANWFGIAPAAAAVLATPLALLTIFVVSLIGEKVFPLSRK